MNAASRRRHQRAIRPVIEGLEGRTLLSLSPLDPTFNSGQAVLNPADPTTGTNQNTATAVAVQPNGKIVVVGIFMPPSTSTASPGLAVRRYNTDGSVDTTFGTNGEADIALPTGSYNIVAAAKNVVINADGTIILAAALESLNTSTVVTTPVESIVARLTSTGAADASFGTNGEVVLAAETPNYFDLAIQPADGKIVLGGTAIGSDGMTQTVVTRLNTDGSTDTTFNGGAILNLSADGSSGVSFSGSPASVLVNSVGKIIVVGSVLVGRNQVGEVAELNSDGTLNTAFGSNGVSSGNQSALSNAALQTDGKIVLVGSYLQRLNADGSVDSSLPARSIPLDYPTSVIVQADGKIDVGGTYYPAGAYSIFAVARFSSTGITDGSFGPSGRATFQIVAPTSVANDSMHGGVNGLALTTAGQVVAVGTESYAHSSVGRGGGGYFLGTQAVVAQLKTSRPVADDYDGDGKADIAAELISLAQFAYRKSNGTGDSVQGFGQSGAGNTIPAPGDYDGDGKTDVAAYIPALGELVYRPSAGGSDVVVPFGPRGAGNAIPAPGDYDGDGKTDVAVYLPASGMFAIRPSSGVANYYIPFGAKGAGASIPAPGDYDGDGKTDAAVYLTSSGTFAYRSSGGGINNMSDVLMQFGTAGPGGSIPAPGDYDGDGLTDVAVYIPAQGIFAVHPSGGANYYDGGGTNYSVPFGTSGAFQSVPAPDDYDGDGKTDLAVYLSATGTMAYRPSSGGNDMLQGFGVKSFGQTIPATSSYATQPPAKSSAGANSNALAAAPAVLIPLTDDVVTPTGTGTLAKKQTSTRLA